MQKYNTGSSEIISNRYVLNLLCIVFALSIVLSACSSPFTNLTNAGANNTAMPTKVPTATPIPTIDPTLTQQGTTNLQAFQQLITQTSQLNADVTTFQQQYTTDQQAIQSAKTTDALNTALTTLNGHLDAMKIAEKKAEALSLQQKLKQQVTDWGKQHTYYNASDNTTYALGYEYGDNGSGGLAQDRIDKAQSVADYQQAVDDLNMYLTNFQAMTTNFNDTTPYYQPHATDQQLIQQNQKTNDKVIIVSLEEQAMRIYQNGQLVKAFLVTTGRPDRPSLAGSWWVELKRAPDTFKSGVKPGNPNYYPDTHINFDLLYHSGEYYIHDSWWRADYGPHTQFPHKDSSGDSFADQGSHGCINMPTASTQWVYDFAPNDTSIIVY